MEVKTSVPRKKASAKLLCDYCKKDWNDKKQKHTTCLPPEYKLDYGRHVLSADYKAALFAQFPGYTTDEIVNTFLGYNSHFPSQSEWELEKEKACYDCRKVLSLLEAENDFNGCTYCHATLCTVCKCRTLMCFECQKKDVPSF